MKWQVRLGLAFLVLVFFFDGLHYLIFRDGEYIFKFLLAQLGFLPISIFLVTVVINQLLQKREKQARLKKVNMVIGSFFSEVGTELVGGIAKLDRGCTEIRHSLLVGPNWTEQDYETAEKRLADYDCNLDRTGMNWVELQDFLQSKKQFLLGLLSNPQVLEHETFTDLLWAVFHLAEEISFRVDINTLPESDIEHLMGDIKRAYMLMLTQWLQYVEHLQSDYPYLFSLAVRTNPFNPEAKPEIE